MIIRPDSKCAIIAAHPDDETLWAGGTILMHPDVSWTIITLCRKSDQDRASKFFRAIEKFNAKGVMGDLDDEPKQEPLDSDTIQNTIMELLPGHSFDTIITHSISGEYTRHLRHEEAAHAVFALWRSGKLQAEQVWSFAYEDGEKKYLPRPDRNADLQIKLPYNIWQQKYTIITEIYGFDKESFEARTTPKEEAFRCYRNIV
jgi:LmbE family N-acetylglucosaminyl deacetylase